MHPQPFLVGLVSLLVAEVGAVAPRFNYVTCGSAMKIAHTKCGARLHSHEVKYPSGGTSSGQNTVTGMMSQSDANSHWKVIGPVTKSGSHGACPKGAPIRCGGTIRLKHVATGCMLHSHAQFKSPLSGNQEVSAVGCPSSPNHA
eukprot:gene20511-13705_t